jgi:type I restriction enzyme M protein
VQRVRQNDLSPKAISNHDMGLAFEELIRRFAEGSNETAGEHFIMSSSFLSSECHLKKAA